MKTAKHLMLLFTWGVTLEKWEDYGLLDRELGYYECMFEAGLEQVDLMTYGHGKITTKIDHRFSVYPKKWVNHNLIYSLLAPFACWRAFRECDIMKTNQSQGAWVGWLVKAIRWKKKLIVRCGWVRTDQMMRRDEGRSGINLRWHKLVEWAAFLFADAIIVVSPIDQEYIATHYKIDKNKIIIIPNSVDTRLYQFSPQQHSEGEKKKVLLVGRLVEMKNFQNVLKAVDGVDEIDEVRIAGDGPYRKELQTLAESISTEVTFLSSIPNKEIPHQLAQADIFVLPQLYASGMPKVLLEAMSVGTPTISSDIPVHSNLIVDQKNGFLCGKSVESIKIALIKVCGMNHQQYLELVTRARRDIESFHDMSTNAKRELALYSSMLSN